MGDRLLHYQPPPAPVRRDGFSAYGLVAAVAAAVAVGVLAGIRSRALPESLWPLGAPCVVFCCAVALVGCALAAMEDRRRRTFLWVGVGMTIGALVTAGLLLGMIPF